MIREAKEEDLKRILDIYNDAILNTTAVYTYEMQTIEEKKEWFKKKKKEGYPVLVFEEEKYIMGFVTYGSFREWPAYKYTIEHSIYVDEKCRHKGIATKLMKELIKLANKKEYKTIVAGIDASNEESLKLHERLGFINTGTLEKVGFKFGRWLNLAFYQLNLTGPKFPNEL